MRIFIGIDLDPAVRARIVRFLEGVQGFAPEARWVRPESLHITLKFIGEQKEEQVAAIAERLRLVRSGPIEIQIAGYGFFPTARAPRVFWIGIQSGSELARLAGDIDETVSELGVPREEREFSPHLTLARAGVHGRRSSGDPKRREGERTKSVFAVLQKRFGAIAGDAPGQLNFGSMTADNFVLYQSHLSPAGSRYTKLERFPLQPFATPLNP